MVDIQKDSSQSGQEEEKQPNPWPSRDGRVSPLEEALHNSLDWGRAILRSKYDYPILILDKSTGDLVEEVSRPQDVIEEVQRLIREWNEDPGNFKNPYEKSISDGSVRLLAPTKPEIKIEVKDY